MEGGRVSQLNKYTQIQGNSQGRNVCAKKRLFHYHEHVGERGGERGGGGGGGGEGGGEGERWGGGCLI